MSLYKGDFPRGSRKGRTTPARSMRAAWRQPKRNVNLIPGSETETPDPYQTMPYTNTITQPPEPKASRSRKPTLLWGILSGLLLGVFALGLASAWISGLDISKLGQRLPEPSFILDVQGQPISELSGSKIEPVPLSQMPIHLLNAIVAVEDKRFYEHRGFDLRASVRALLRDLDSGSFDEGGSTITQQLAKNIFLSSDKTVTRKIKELGYAIKIHFTYSKEEILELYLNSIYFGEGGWGVENAAKQYFGKSVQKLTLAESAMIAGLPKAPTHYSPIRHPEAALERRNLVLSLMKEQKMIAPDAYDKAVAEPIKLQLNYNESLKGKHLAFVDYVMDEAESKYHITEQQILTMGLRIQTTMDLNVQQAAEDIFAQDDRFPSSPDGRKVQGAAVILDPRTGGVRALIGGRGESTYRGFNRATEMKRQPGSSLKPLSVYGPALERGYTADSMLYDRELDIAGYKPRDWDGQTRGEVSLKEAILRSWNIPAVWLLNEIGIDAGLDYLKRSGIELTGKDRNLSLALGGLSEGVSPLQMARAYGAIANQGVMQEAHVITKILTKDGTPLVEEKTNRNAVTSTRVAYRLTALLQEAVSSGTGQAAALNGRPAAGKTGTTQLPDTEEFKAIGRNGAKDAWFVGFTPELTAAIWIGYDQTDRTHYLTTSGGAVPAQLFKDLMTRALQDKPVNPFPMPAEVRKQMEEQTRELGKLEKKEMEEQSKQPAENAHLKKSDDKKIDDKKPQGNGKNKDHADG